MAYQSLTKLNDPLNSLIGLSYNQKTKHEANKILKEIHSRGNQRLIGKTALCIVTDHDEIKGAGGSTLLRNTKTGEIESNLVLDQFGELMSGLFGPLTTGPAFLRRNMTNISNSNQAVGIYENEPFTDNDGGKIFGTKLQVGSGSTTPARTNFNIETAFGTSPEDTFFTGSVGAWTSGSGNFTRSGSIVAGGAGTVNESLLYADWARAGQIAETYALFRDLISPGVAFIATENIALTYTITM